MFFLFLGKKKSFWEGKGRKWTAVLIISLILAVVLPFGPDKAKVSAEEISLYSTAAVLMDADNGRVLYGKNADDFMANASTTKIMTCIVALENADLDDIVEVSSYAAGMPKVKLYIKAGEHYKLEDLLYSLMLESHNDSAVAIAEHVGGSVEGFSDMMNKKAVEIGCKSTCFLTPNGLDATRTLNGENGSEICLSHGTTARDLARIMAYCCFESDKSEEFLKITRTASYSFVNEEGRNFNCNNHNMFLNMMDGALSGKTGFTNKAGYCYVGALEKDGKRFTIALLACGWPNHKNYKWSDAKELFSHGLEKFEKRYLSEAKVEKRAISPIPVKEAQGDYFGEEVWVEVKLNGSIEGKGLLLSEEEKIRTRYDTVKELQAPVREGQVVGHIYYIAADEILCTQEIVAASSAEKINFPWLFSKIIKKFLL